MKYRVKAEAIEDLDCGYLIDAVCRYMNASTCPLVADIIAILAIEEVKNDDV